MSRSKSDPLLSLTESFFRSYLQRTRGASAHTIRAYRDTLRLLFLFLATQKRKPVAGLVIDDIQSDAVLAFLDHVESQRGNSAVTRNCRLAAVRSFVQHLLRQDVTRAGQYGRILAIRSKRALRRAAIYLEPEEARAVISTIDCRSRGGQRDHALLLFLYNTGARVSEALAIRACDLRLERPRQVRLLGKGQKRKGLSALVRNCVGPASYHPRWRHRPRSLQERIRCAANTRRRRLRVDQICETCGGANTRPTKASDHPARHASQLRSSAFAGGHRCFRHSRLSRSCISRYHQPLHHN